MSPLHKARLEMHQIASGQALHAFHRLLVEREAELIEEFASAPREHADLHQARFQELRGLRDLLKTPTTQRERAHGEIV